MTQATVIQTEQRIIRTGRWVMAFGFVCIVRLLFQLPLISNNHPIYVLLFLMGLSFGIFAILSGEGLTRKARWAMPATMIIGGVLMGGSSLGGVGMLHLGFQEWDSSKPFASLGEFGPGLIQCLVTLAFWSVTLRSLLKLAVLLRVRDPRLPAQWVLRVALTGSFVVGATIAVAQLLPNYFVIR